MKNLILWIPVLTQTLLGEPGPRGCPSEMKPRLVQIPQPPAHCSSSALIQALGRSYVQTQKLLEPSSRTEMPTAPFIPEWIGALSSDSLRTTDWTGGSLSKSLLQVWHVSGKRGWFLSFNGFRKVARSQHLWGFHRRHCFPAEEALHV
uniref:Uncharacterized protein n=1 Tax=Micrurus surinamensis TaxID=129470 RepID=A0A2D4NYU6_MICSU